MEEYIFDVGVLDKNGNEIDEIFISAPSEREMWDIFDEDYIEDYEDYSSAVIYGCDLA